jgi:hypothetical protein
MRKHPAQHIEPGFVSIGLAFSKGDLPDSYFDCWQ